MTLVASAMAGGDCIDDTDAMCSGSTGRDGLHPGCVHAQGAIHPGNFPAQLPAGATPASWTG